MDNRHYSVTGFKRNKRNKTTKTLFITTTLTIEEIRKAMTKCRYVWNSIVDVDSFTDKPYTWRHYDDVDVPLTLFDELIILKAISGMKC